MTDQLIWILEYIFAVILFRFVGLNVLHAIRIKLPDNGYSIANHLGLLILGYISWASTSVMGFPFSQSTALLILIISVLISAAYSYRSKNYLQFYSNTKFIALPEIIFYIFFIGMLIIRSYIPEINVIEDFMNFGIMNSLIRSEHLPLQDIWYSGNNINYYYFGHYLFAFVQKIIQVPSAALYNIYLASIVASGASISAFIGIYISGKIKAAIFSPFILILSGNLDYLIYVVSKHSFADYYYGNARNLVENVITEFPSYSFILGNLHAHIINIPSVLLVIVFCIYFYKEKIIWAHVITVGLFLGILGMTNSWDLLIYLPFAIYMLIINSQTDLKTKVKYIILLTVTAVVTMIPFLLNFRPPVSGIGFVRDWIPYVSILTMFGMFFIGFILFIINYKSSDKNRLILIMFGYALALIITPQIIYLKDIYDSANPPFYKANTVFKFWYQAYIILSIILIPSIISFINLKTKPYKSILNYLIILVLLISIVFSIAYSALAYKYKIDSSFYKQTLRGDEYLDQSDSRKPMIDWLNDYVKNSPVILEAPGDAYTSGSLVSSYTGLPTPIGWINHEFGWRNNWPEIALRLGDAEILYNSTNPDEIWPLLDKYQIRYVVLSQKEKEKYGINAGQGIRLISEPVVKVGDDELLKIPEFTL